MLRSLLLALLVLPSAHAQFAFLGLDEKCSACKAIVYELDRAMRFETPQENIRIGRQTLSTDGKRTGSSVDYKHSELRAITIIDNLCPTMQHYGKVVKEGESRWMRVNYAEGDVVIDGSMTLGGAKSETEGKALKLYCDKIVEEQEDEWVEATQAGVDQLEERICSDMMKLCGDAAKKALAKQMAEEKRLKAKYSKPALTVEAKRLRKKMKKVDQLKEDIKRMERIQKEKILQKNKLLKDIDAYVLKIKKKQKDMVAAEKAVNEEKEEQAKGDDEL